MISAAGILVIAPGDRALFLLRGPGSDHPLGWAFPGGQMETGETAAECAARETMEECGLEVSPEALGKVHTRGIGKAQPAAVVAEMAEPAPQQSEDVDFTTFVHRVEAEFVPLLCDEHVGYCWAPMDHPPGPLHPGALVALQRFSMNELGLARAMAAGQLVSPQRYENVTLFNLRITGTGAAYRKGLDEYVWRDPSIYLNDEFVQRCNGLPVIWVHPKKATLNSKEFADRIIGTMFLPYVRGDEVWGIAKVFDDDAIEAMVADQLSTSPTVVFRDPTVNVRMELEDGAKVLIEGDPSLLDHLAICAAGVWDKGNDPVGVDRTAVELTVADAEEPEPVHFEFILARARMNALSHRIQNLGRAARRP